MPFRRVSIRNRSRYYRRGTGTRFVAKRYTNRVTGREVPYYLGPGTEAHVNDVALAPLPAPSAVDTLVSSTPLNLISRGTGIFERESIRASMKYMLLRYRIGLLGVVFPTAGSNLPIEPATCRVLLVYCSRPVLAAPAVSDFLTVPGGSSTLFATSGVQRIDSRENYQILYDNKFVLRNTNGANTTGASQVLRPEGDFTFRDIDVRLPINRPCSFTSTSVSPITPADLTSGLLVLYTLVDNVYFNATQYQAVGAAGSSRLVFSP